MTPDADSVEWLDTAAGERVRWVGRPGLTPIIPFVVIAIGVSLFGVLLAAALGPADGPGPIGFVLIGFAIGIGLFVVGWRLVQRRNVAYAITTGAVYERTGTSAATDVSGISLAAIESASVDQSVLARFVDRGDVRMYAPTAERTSLTLDGVSRPNDVHALLIERNDRRDTSDTDRDAADADSAPPDAGSATLDGDSATPDVGSGVEGSSVDGTDRGSDGSDGGNGDRFIWGPSSNEDGGRDESGDEDENERRGASDTDTIGVDIDDGGDTSDRT